MGNGNFVAQGSKAILEARSDGDGPVPSTGTPDADAEIAALVSLEQRHEEREECLHLLQELTGGRIAQDVLLDSRVLSGERLEFRYEIGVAQETNVEQQIDVVWDAEFVPEGHERNGHPSSGRILSKFACQPFPQIVNGDIRGIYDAIGVFAELAESLTLEADTVEHRHMRK